VEQLGCAEEAAEPRAALVEACDQVGRDAATMRIKTEVVDQLPA
jgi:hypothetical protein